MQGAHIRAWVEVCRPHQYVKNAFVFLPLFFDHRLADTRALAAALVPFVLFCLAGSGVYVVNDILDADEDRKHPVKSRRPVASGALSLSSARALAAVLFGAVVAGGLFWAPPGVAGIVGAYAVLMVLYSLFLKHLAVVDVFVIAVGLVMRVFAGGLATGTPISRWLVLMTFLLALFLALAKRRDDLLLAEKGFECRTSLDGYTLDFVSLGMGVMASVTIVAYILYTVSPDVIAKHGTDRLYLTAFWVILGIFRYMQVTFVKERSGSPTKVLLRDPFLQATVVLWVASFYILLYL